MRRGCPLWREEEEEEGEEEEGEEVDLLMSNSERDCRIHPR